MRPFEALEQHRGRVEQIAENSARLAFSYAAFDSLGWGEFQVPTVVTFDVTFIERPYVSYAYSVDGDTLVKGRFPRAQGFVYKWRLDTKGFYTGCWVGFTVETQSPFIDTDKDDPGYSLDHHFTFAGNAYKDLPSYLLDE